MDVFGFKQIIVPTGSKLALYTCPVPAELDVGTALAVRPAVQDKNVQTTVTSIIITNETGGALTFNMWLTPAASTTILDTHLIARTHSLNGLETIILAQGLVLGADNTVWLDASGLGLFATINRIETS